MQNHCRHLWKKNAWVLAAAVIGLSLFTPTSSKALPYTHHFTPLIVELQTRSAMLTNRLNKVERQQKQAVDRTLALLRRTVSTTEIRDLNNATTITKTLSKAFPFQNASSRTGALPTEPVLEALLIQLFVGFNGDISNLVATAQTSVDGLAAGSCHDKAQLFLNQATTALQAPGVKDLTSFAKSLTLALKATLRAEALAASNACLGGGNGSDSLSMTINTIPWAAATGSTGGAYTQRTKVLVITGAQDNRDSFVSIIATGVTGPGTYTAHITGNYATFTPALLYFVSSGQLTITSWNLSSHKLIGTFTFVASAGANIVNATQCVFNLKGLTVK